VSELTDLIDRMVVEKTFSLDALEVVKELKNRAELLEGQLKANRDLAENAKRREEEAKAENALLQMEIGVLKARETAVAEREKTVTAMEQRVAVAEAREKAGIEMAERFLKLPSVRRNVTESIGHVVPTGTPPYPSVYTATNSEQVVETHE